MTTTMQITLAVMFVLMLATVVGLTVLCAILCWKTLRILMHFHQAGQGMAQIELQNRQMALREKELELDKLRTEHAIANNNTPAGGSYGRRTPDNVVEVAGA
jgi:hypothetical protein